MDEQTILNALAAGEASDWEFKSAKGGVPGNLWETYSAMANTDGGTIVLGVDDNGTISGLPDPDQARKNLWDNLNNRGKVSINLLSEGDVQPRTLEGKAVLVMRVSRATRQQRPVFVGQNPLTGTFRRNYEGDYHCTEYEVGRMWADRAEEPADGRILEHFTLGDVDEPSLQQYRQRFSARVSEHPWLALDSKGLLEKLGGWSKDRLSGKEGLTVAGLLMFGKDQAIRDQYAVPEFHVDYRERLSEDPKVRWTDRLTIDGTWNANVFQFYQRVIQKLTADLKIPFQLEKDLSRKDDTIVHEGVREALVNALIHADYRGQGGVIVEKYRDRFEMSNPGTLLLSREQILKGGVSECRNRVLQGMFLLIGRGEKAGSGLDKIRQAWRSQHWRLPGIRQIFQPDRVELILPMVSLLPEESVARLRTRFGSRFDELEPLEVQALITADVEGEVSNARMQEVSEEHPAELTHLLQGLAGAGLLVQEGQKRGTRYRLPLAAQTVTSDSPHLTENSPHLPGYSPHLALGSPQLPDEDWGRLKQIADPAARQGKLPAEQLRGVILELCRGRYLTMAQLCGLMNRTPKNLRDRTITPMVKKGLLRMRFPEEPNRPDQAYTAVG